MHKTIFLFLLVCLCLDLPRDSDLCGIWVNYDKSNVFRFNQDKTCTITYKLGESDTFLITGNYEVNFNKKPIPLTIRNIPQLNHPLHTIIKFRGENELFISEFAPRWRVRPISFHGKKITILKKIGNLKKENESINK